MPADITLYFTIDAAAAAATTHAVTPLDLRATLMLFLLCH